MSQFLYLGMTMYHKTNKTKCIIKNIDKDNITISLSKSITKKDELVLPKTHIGEWLFYNEDEIKLSKYDLMNMPEYFYFKNKIILQAYDIFLLNQKIKQQRRERKAIEEKRKYAEMIKIKKILKD